MQLIRHASNQSRVVNHLIYLAGRSGTFWDPRLFGNSRLYLQICRAAPTLAGISTRSYPCSIKHMPRPVLILHYQLVLDCNSARFICWDSISTLEDILLEISHSDDGQNLQSLTAANPACVGVIRIGFVQQLYANNNWHNKAVVVSNCYHISQVS